MNTFLFPVSSLIVHLNPSRPASPNHTNDVAHPVCDMLGAVTLSRLLPQASRFPSTLAHRSHRIGFTFVPARRSASGCSPPRLSATQFPSAADAHVCTGLRLSRSEFMYVMTH
jgi:hypothetical protein